MIESEPFRNKKADPFIQGIISKYFELTFKYKKYPNIHIDLTV